MGELHGLRVSIDPESLRPLVYARRLWLVVGWLMVLGVSKREIQPPEDDRP